MSAKPMHKSSTRYTKAVDERARLIRLVHVGRRELKLNEDEYRTILQAQGGSSSCASMSLPKLRQVLDYLRAQGFKVKVASKAKPTGQRAVALASDPESRKARAMWLTLHAIGQVRDPSETALLAYTKRQTGVERMEWIVDMVPVLESLKAWLLRSLPGKVRPYLLRASRSWAPHMPDAWHKNWDQAVRRLNLVMEKGNSQVIDEWVDLWELIVSQKLQVGGGLEK